MEYKLTPEHPKVFISYSHDSADHTDRVLQLSNRLRDDGIDCVLDQYEESPSEGWPRWMDKNIREADFVLMVCTETYFRRVIGEEQPSVGHGVRWEGHLIYQYIYDVGTLNTKFIPILLDPSATSHIPTLFKATTHYKIYKEEGYESLRSRITNQPKVLKQALGKLHQLPRKQRKQDFFAPWNVPDHNPFFTGRDKILRELHHALKAESAVALTQPLAISGLGGIGKTQTAIQFAHLNRRNYQAVLWVNADSHIAMIASYISIARLLGLPEKDEQDHFTVIAAVKRWLETKQEWLIIFDNADQPELIRSFLPSHPKGHILLTSRAQVFQTLGIARPVELKDMLPEEALEFLLNRTGRTDTSTSEKKAAEEIANELGYLPLALEQAAAFISAKQSRFQDYLKSLKKRYLKLLQENTPHAGNYPESVYTTWDINFQQIEKTDVVSAEILRFSAFLSPNDIPIELLWVGAPELGTVVSEALENLEEDPIRLDEHMAPLSQYSLITRNFNSNTYSIHRLVQEVLKNKIGVDNQEFWAERTVRAIDRAFPAPDSVRNWPSCERLIVHAKVGAAYLDDFPIVFPRAATFLNRVGFYLKEHARFSEAEALFMRAVDIDKKNIGSENPEFATSLNNLADIYSSQGKYSDAEILFKRSLAIREKTLGLEHPDVANSLNNLATLLDDQGRYTEAETFLKRSLDIFENALGLGHPDVATSLNNLAMLYSITGRYDEAESFYKRSIDIRESALGPEHPSVAVVLNNLAGLYFDFQNRYSEAEPLLKRSLDIWVKALGPEHPDVATSLNNLARLYSITGRYDEAESFYKRSVDIREKVLGAQHPDVAISLHNLAALFDNEGRYSEAEQLLKHSLNIMIKTFGPEHPDVATSFNNIGRLYYKMGNYNEAEPLLKKSLDIRENTLGSEHPEVGLSLHNLAELYNVQGKYTEAEPLFRRSLTILEEALPPNHPNITTALKNFASFLRKTKRPTEANQLETLVLEAQQQVRRGNGSEGC